ncbi:MAG: oligosaccharide flippase family protein [Ktedonobacteraceae bacterium]|nr:oligosaccharide flippase family protein [Ktedonobacteraceae bacterium]
MQKTKLRPSRLIRVSTDQLAGFAVATTTNEGGRIMGSEDGLNIPQNETQAISTEPTSMPPGTLENTLPAEMPQGEAEARHLLRRTPGNYLINQIYGLWFLISLFLLTIIITRKVPTEQYGIYAITQTACNTILYIFAFGMEDATTTYVPRIFAEHGTASAALLVRRLLTLRILTVTIVTGILLFGMPTIATLIAAIPISGAGVVAAGLRDSALLSHITPVALYVLGSSIASLLQAVCAGLMRIRIVFVIGSLTQVGVLAISFVVLQLGWGINSVLWTLAICSLLNAAAFILWQARFIFTRGATYKQPIWPLIRLGLSAWQTNLIQGALLKQVSVILLGIFAISAVAGRINTGYFNLSFQLADGANLLLVSGFGGIASAALAAAFVGNNHERLSRSWQALVKIETLLAAPGLVFCLFNASTIVQALYGTRYTTVGPLFAIFLFFNIFARILGTTINQYALYVTGKARLVVLSEWAGLVGVIIIGIILIPGYGAAGALIADGIARIITGVLMLAFLWNALPHKYPLVFTLRFLLALTIAALPGILWHPANRILLGLSGCLFLVLCAGLLLAIKPLSEEDMVMLGGLNKRLARYLRWFARSKVVGQKG